MIGRKRLGLLAAVAAALGSDPIAAAADDQWPPVAAVSLYGDPNRPDISGLWMGTAMGIPGQGVVSNSGKSADGRPPSYWSPWPLPYTTAYRKIYDERVASAKKGVQLGDISSKCLPFGLPTMVSSMNYPQEIVQTPGQVTFFEFGTFPIVVWTDGRSHPKGLAPSYNGHSIGYWQGRTLVVDTVGIMPTTSLDSHRDAHSGKLHLKWTVSRVAPDVLHTQITLYDDEAFTEPVTMTNIAHRKTDAKWALLDDQSCFENNQDVPPPDKASGFIKF
ncbi:hypothetical protein [Sphingomonas bacterium]|uniref:hypothetical protein n=1 Tax=Sphingomonas bacterium TaxID=1895847 RepID=UPI001574FD49|nr:hypothetical protein [Sphingomonas bacterium]